ncbi:MAG: hypothetical protein ACLUSP_07665 [Christensenellales bacterium]
MSDSPLVVNRAELTAAVPSESADISASAFLPFSARKVIVTAES